MLIQKNTLFPSRNTHFHLNDEKHCFPYLHHHDFYEIFVVLSGEVRHTIHDTAELLPAGNAVLVYPQDCHKIETEKGLLLNLAYSHELLCQTAAFLDLEPGGLPRRHLFSQEELAWLLGESKRILSSQEQATQELLLKALLAVFLSRFAAEPVLQESSRPEWFSILLARLTRPEIFTKDTREICALAGYTPAYVSRCFRNYLNTTLTEYTQKLRIRYACGLLASTDLPVADICYTCGFQNLSHFYHCFQKICGIPPKKYRDRHKYVLF